MSDQTQIMSNEQRRDWLHLIRSDRVGPIIFYKLLEQFGTDAEAKIEQITAAGAILVTRGESDYPPLLARIEDAPPLLFVIEHLHLLRKKAVGIIGTRNASLNVHRIAASFAGTFGEVGYLVSSCMARGIDRSAYEGALNTSTVAVRASGADVVIPRKTKNFMSASLKPVSSFPKCRSAR